jgi:hypothetical protein
MHLHPDRDTLIQINLENIQEGRARSFDKYSRYTDFETPYDMESVMHYDSLAYSKNGKPTMSALNPAHQYKIYGTKGKKLSTGDILMLNRMYDCKNLV